MANDWSLSDVGVVVIGRNEGERLIACLGSISVSGSRAVYVDSGSSDQSVAAAKALGWTVVQLDMSVPFSAARARNAGLAALMNAAPTLKLVQFVDGDCELAAGWLLTAARFLSAHDDVAVVCGRRRERHPERSVYNRLCDIEWNTPIGEAKACGGDSMMRTDALAKVQGFNPSIIAGEEPELCFRLSAQGYRIWRLDAEMTLHDAAMLQFSQWWRRGLRSGYGNAQVSWLQAGVDGGRMQSANIRAFIWAAVLPAFIALAALWHPAALLLLLLYPLQIARIAWKRGPTELQSWQYAFFIVLGNFPGCLGTMKFIVRTWRNQQSTLIEYKQPGA